MPKKPEEWLEVASPPQKSRGIFKLFLGYAPGVGKTFSMLSEAIRRRSRGEDVVVGVVESHGRKGIEELIEEIRPASYVCLDSVQGSDSENGAGTYDFIADESQTEPWEGTARREMSSLIEGRLQQLPEMQRKVLALYYFEDLRLREIAEAFGVTESRICQIHSQAILAIKALLKKQDPETFNHC